uniref:receptor protein-tyrosine kinase n=1 Tax=Gouania willdenowi TaxID=441366 RepID=A0A8C5D4H9_GOUWI
MSFYRIVSVWFGILLPLTAVCELLISPNGPHVVVPMRGKLELRCYDNATASGTPARLKWQKEKARRLEGEVEEGGVAYVKVSVVQPYHMGCYVCVNNITLEHRSIYVYVKDPQNVFQRTMVNGILVRAGENCIIPCLVTDPEVTMLDLETCSGQPLPSGMSYRSSLQRGIIISNAKKEYEGCYLCVGQLSGVRVTSSHYTVDVRLGKEKMEEGVVVSKENNADALQDPNERQSSHILSGSRGYQRSTRLLIPAVNQSDSGVYKCYADNEKGRSEAAILLKYVFSSDRGFITMLGEPSPVHSYVKEGESLSLKVHFDAYPPPKSLLWSHNGKRLLNTTEYNSELRLVRVVGSEGGIYNFSVSHHDASVVHSFHVYVNSKPVIIAQEGPVDGQVRCIAAGHPVPKISWYFCEQPHTRCSHLPNATQWETTEVIMLTESLFGRSEVESRLNVTKELAHFNTLESLCIKCYLTLFIVHLPLWFVFSERVVPHKLFTPVLIGMVATGVALSFILMVMIYKYMQKPKFQIQWKVIESIHGNSYTYIDTSQLPYDSKWEFSRQKLRFGKTLGSGAFGKVVRATAYGLCSPDTVTTVAVKMLKPNAHSTEKEALMSELKVLIYLGNHVNIVNLLGACTIGGPILVITEYCCYGDLLNFLRRKRESFLNSQVGDGYYRNVLKQTHGDTVISEYVPMRPSEKERVSQSGTKSLFFFTYDIANDIDELSLDAEDLLSFSYQVAKGMEYVTSRNCIHRDIAARNVLLTHGRVAKICDFGLARDINTDASYVLRGNARLPVKWMSPESIFDCVYTFESDVWSYGILLWEIFSLGNSPYPGMQVDSAFYQRIQEGYRMSKPAFAPIEIYDMMLSCWNPDPLKRPSFRKLVERSELLLSENTKNVYLTLSNAPSHPEQQRVPSRRLSSVCSTTAPTQPLLQNSADVFVDYV